MLTCQSRSSRSSEEGVHQPAPLSEGLTMIRYRFWTRLVKEVSGRHRSRQESELALGFRFEIRIDGQSQQNIGLRGVCAALPDPPSRTTKQRILGRGTTHVLLKIRRTDDEAGSATCGGEDKKVSKGVESHRKIEARCFTVYLECQSVTSRFLGSSCPNQP